MSAPLCRISKEVRSLIVELGHAFEKFHEQTATLAEPTVGQAVALDVGAEREHQKNIILGIAHRLNEAANK